MMNRYIFRFGYCTPLQWKGNEANGWDDEASSAFIVVADSEEAALKMGAEAAEVAVAAMFVRDGWPSPTPSWKAADFAHWLERLSSGVFSEEQLAALPVIAEDDVCRAGELLPLPPPA